MAEHDYHCPTCRAPFRLPADQPGEVIRCGQCGNTFVPAEAPLIAGRPIARAVSLPPAGPEEDAPLEPEIVEDIPLDVPLAPPPEPPLVRPVARKVTPSDLPPRSRRREVDDEDGSRVVLRRRTGEPAAGEAPPRERQAEAELTDVPRPKVGVVVAVLGAIAVVVVAAFSLIGFAILAGFQAAVDSSLPPPAPALVEPGGGGPDEPEMPPASLRRMGELPPDKDAGAGGDWGSGRPPNPFRE